MANQGRRCQSLVSRTSRSSQRYSDRRDPAIPIRAEKFTREKSKEGLHSLVGAVDVVDGQDGQVAVITEIAQGETRAGLELELADGLLGGVEGDRHGENVAIGKTAVLANTERKSVSANCFSISSPVKQFLSLHIEYLVEDRWRKIGGDFRFVAYPSKSFWFMKPAPGVSQD